MGNRAVIAFTASDKAPAIYIHWNGGRASVEAFLIAAKEAGIEYTDEKTTLDEIAQLLAEHFFGTKVGFTVYRFTYGEADTDNGDNGTYLINRDLEIKGRLFVPDEEEVNTTKTQNIVRQIRENLAQPVPTFVGM